jgi:hypothetical protein
VWWWRTNRGTLPQPPFTTPSPYCAEGEERAGSSVDAAMLGFGPCLVRARPRWGATVFGGFGRRGPSRSCWDKTGARKGPRQGKEGRAPSGRRPDFDTGVPGAVWLERASWGGGTPHLTEPSRNRAVQKFLKTKSLGTSVRDGSMWVWEKKRPYARTPVLDSVHGIPDVSVGMPETERPLRFNDCAAGGRVGQCACSSTFDCRVT